jgi:hypothetical protein
MTSPSLAISPFATPLSVLGLTQGPDAGFEILLVPVDDRAMPFEQRADLWIVLAHYDTPDAYLGKTLVIASGLYTGTRIAGRKKAKVADEPDAGHNLRGPDMRTIQGLDFRRLRREQ